MSDFPDRKQVAAWRFVFYGVVTAAGIVAVGYYQGAHDLYVSAAICGGVIGGLGFVLSWIRASIKPVEMDASVDPIDSKKSFFYRAAWCSVFIPLLTVGATILLFAINGHKHPSFSSMETYCVCAFGLQIVSLILGITSLFGISKYGTRLILRKAVFGIIASCLMGFYLVLLDFANAMGHGS